MRHATSKKKNKQMKKKTIIQHSMAMPQKNVGWTKLSGGGAKLKMGGTYL